MPEPEGDPEADAVESGGTERRAGAHLDGTDTTPTHRIADERDPSGSSSDPVTVLVVEDEQALANLYRDWLTDSYDVRVAKTGREALDQLDAAVDVVLLDRRLPDVPGRELLDTIRASDADYQVAMVTAVEPDVDVFEMGFDDYVSKPIDRDELRSLVSSLVARDQYSGYVQRYFRLLSKRAALEREFDGDLSDCPDYQQLLADIAAVESDLGDVVETFTARDFDAQFYWFSDGSAAAGD